MRGVRRGRDVLVTAAGEQRRQRAEEPGRVAERPVLLEPQVEQALAQEDDHLRPRQHADVRREADLERELADQPVAEGVERRDRRVRVAVRDELVHPELHLLRGLVRERQREDLRRSCPPRRDQPGDPAGDDLGLAGPRARDDEERALAVGDRAPLLRVEPIEERRDAARNGLGGAIDARVGGRAPARSRARPGSARGGGCDAGIASGSSGPGPVVLGACDEDRGRS